MVVGRDVEQLGFGTPCFWRPVFATPQGGTEGDSFAHTRLFAHVIGRTTRFFVDAFEHIVVDIRNTVDIVDLAAGLTLQHPKVAIATCVHGTLDIATVDFGVYQHRCADLIPIPCVVLVVLMMALDLAGVQIHSNGGGGVEVVTITAFCGPGRRVARAPISDIGCRVVCACDPDAATTIFVAVAGPCIPARFTGGRCGVGAPDFFARVGIKSGHVATHTGFATGGTYQNFAFGGQGCKGDVVQCLHIANGRVPNHFASFGVQGNQVRVNSAHINLVAIQCDTTVGVVQHQQVSGDFFFVAPEFFTRDGIQSNHLTIGGGDVHVAVVHDGRCLVTLGGAG